ncbi:hypothetical protein [Yersinia kristensenii]|nr:hypothetical protein [Yersinia kristensenii]
MQIMNTQASIISPTQSILHTQPIKDILSSHSIEELKYKYGHSSSKEKNILEKEILKHIIFTFDSKSFNTNNEYFLRSEEK